MYKFGGASVKDANGVKNLKRIVAEYPGSKLLIVVSAMGKSTNLLEKIVSQKLNKEDFHPDLELFLTYHNEICRELFGELPVEMSDLEASLKQSLDMETTEPLEFQDLIVSYGELFSTVIVSKHLDAIWVDARRLIKTDSKFTEGEVDWDKTHEDISADVPKQLENGVVITQGFIGSDAEGRTTTLGREGSDFSAAIFAHCLNATSVTVWKDVPGLLNADPKVFPSAEKFDHISYQEVIEMTYYGAKVIHPKTIRPLAQKNIPLFVRSFIDPEGEGTRISEDQKIANKTCFVFKENQLLVSVRVRDNSFMDEHKMSFILLALSQFNIKANMTHNSALTFTICMDNNTAKRDRLVEHLSENYQVLYNEDLFMATIKNYDEGSFGLLPGNIEPIFEEKSRSNYQVVYRVK
ncbi:MAG: aspartate kinase [Cyclobacteriaceae bacterium]